MPTATVIRPEPPPEPRQSPFVPGVQPPEPFTLVILGATGDLASRKLLPALHGLWQGRLLPQEFALVGVGRRDKDDSAFREDVRTAVAKVRQSSAAQGTDDFLAHVFYQRADF